MGGSILSTRGSERNSISFCIIFRNRFGFSFLWIGNGQVQVLGLEKLILKLFLLMRLLKLQVKLIHREKISLK